MNFGEYIIQNFKNGIWNGFSLKRICGELGVKSSFEREAVKNALKNLEKSGEIAYIDGVFVDIDSGELIKGEIRGNERGYAFLIPENGAEKDLFIPHKSLFGALDKDTVLVRRVEGTRGSSDEAEVVKILKRGVAEFYGTFIKKRAYNYVIPDDAKYADKVVIPHKFTKNAKTGDKVKVGVIGYNEDFPEGEIEEIAGKSGDFDAEERAIIGEFGFKEYFPDEVKAEVSEIPQEVKSYQLEGREDFRDRTIITIDGDDSRDFDDAVEVERLSNGNFRLGVHIADVSEYVKKGSRTDDEAFSRGTSVYFPEKVIPMLPEELSNGICSLNEGVDRLTLSVIAEIDGKGDVKDSRIVKGVIRSRRRTTYKKVQAVLSGDAEVREEYADIADMLSDMLALKNVLSKKRDGRGRVNLDSSEAEIMVKDGKISVEPRKSGDAYEIIEEFMVLANEITAEYAFFAEIPYIYRVHEKPSREKAEFLVNFINLFGISVKWKTEEPRPSDFAAVLEKAKDRPYYHVINKVTLRSMQKAFYSPENKGHFGLSSTCYCHFTSPIRRYPDLVVHRVIKMMLEGRIGELNDLYADYIKEAAASSSKSEMRADAAERRMDDLYKTAYMKDRIGEEFDAVISGVTPNCVFSELENTVEGVTYVEDLPRGNYVFDEKTFTLSAGGRKSYSLGDKVRVGVISADLTERRTRFLILGKIT